MSQSFYESSKGRLLFGLRGRIPRTQFWVGLAVIAALTTLAVMLGGHSARIGSMGAFFTLVSIVAILSPVCLIAVIVKRLHDLDRSGWLALPLVVLPLLCAAVAAITASGLKEGRIMEEWVRFWTIVSYASAALAGVPIAYVIIRLGFTRGTPGANRFGPDPLQPQDEPAAETEAT
jgi:uncharacterized membrane protein YhaH (DUF805 family)